jgi:hypothetical protein
MEPDAPRKPVLVSVDETQISVSLPQAVNDNGAIILSYTLLLNEGVNGTPFNIVLDYDGISSTF